MKQVSRIVAVALLLVVALLPWDAELLDYVRFDRFEMYMSVFRSFAAIMTIMVSLHLIRIYCVPLYSGLLLPTNLFLILFGAMVLPGLLLTSDFSAAGRTSFYGYLLATVAFAIGAAGASWAGSFRPKKELASFVSVPRDSYPVKGTTYAIMIGAYILVLPIVLASIDLSRSVYEIIFEFLLTGAMPENAREIATARQGIYLDRSQLRSTAAVIASYSVVLVMPLSAAFVLLNGLIKRHRTEIILGSLMAALAFGLLIFSGTRLRGLSFLLFLVTAISFYRPLRFRKLVNWSVPVAIFLVLQTVALGRMVGADNYIGNIIMSGNRVVERIFMAKGNTTQVVFHYIPGVVDFKRGETLLTSISGSLTKKTSFDEEMYEYIYGYQGTAGPHGFAEAYANFGVLGMILASVLLGLLIQSITILIVRRPTLDSFNLVVMAMVCVLFAKTGYSDLLAFKSNGLHILILYVLLVGLIRKCLGTFSSRASLATGRPFAAV